MQPRDQARGIIEGRVTRSGGKPIAGAVVLITGSSPAHRDIAALTNERGEYRFDDLVIGTYTILVNGFGMATHLGQATVEIGKITRLDFSLDA